MHRKLRKAIVAASAAAALFTAPAESHAIFHWFSRACGCGAQPATYAPATYAPAVVQAPLPAPTVVNYVPQTCYRTQYVNAPVTTYRPVMGCDPCTGFPVTTMRPVTSYVQQARLVPYTTYRAVVAAAPCSPCGGAAVRYAPAAPCSGCGSALAAPAQQPYYNPAPMSAGQVLPGVPTLAPGVNPGVSNFPGSPPPAAAPAEIRQRPIVLPGPDAGDNSGVRSRSNPVSDPKLSEPKLEGRAEPASSAPRLINPGDRTTRSGGGRVIYAVQRTAAEEVAAEQPVASNHRQVAWPRDTVAGPAQAEIKAAPRQVHPARPADQDAAQDGDGWRPSKR
jgi:hypothetical protein